MSLYPTTYRDLTGNASVEAMELADAGGGFGLPDDVAAEMDAAFGYGTEADELTEREIDALYVAEMERRDAAARDVFGGGSDDSGGDDNDPPPYAAGLALYPDDYLIDAVAKVDASLYCDGEWVAVDPPNPEEPDVTHPTLPGWILKRRADKAEFLACAADELLRRAGRLRRAA
jgi:hypothetical protein